MKLVLLALFFVTFVAGCIASQQDQSFSNVPQLQLSGFVKANVSVVENNIVLSSGCYMMPMQTTEQQASYVEGALANATPQRPVPHDLMKNILGYFDVRLLMVKVHSMSDETFFSTMMLAQGSKVLSLDAKPSDAIAVALRTGSPVYVNNSMLEEQGVKVC